MPHRTPAQQLYLPEGMEYQIKHRAECDIIPLHLHECCEILLSLSGNVIYSVEDRKYNLVPGTILIIAPFEIHESYPASGEAVFERYSLHISPDMIRRLSSPKTNLYDCFNAMNPMHTTIFNLNYEKQKIIGELMREIWKQSKEAGGDEYGSDTILQYSFLRLLYEVNMISRDSTRQYEMEDPANQLVSRVIAYIEEHYPDPLTLSQLADKFHVSKDYLSHIFTYSAGCAPYQFIERIRLRNAADMLRRGMSPTVVAEKCGYYNYANFFRQFKRRYSVSPKEYSSASKSSRTLE
jgi:AraC-like DNA-binding protein